MTCKAPGCGYEFHWDCLGPHPNCFCKAPAAASDERRAAVTRIDSFLALNKACAEQAMRLETAKKLLGRSRASLQRADCPAAVAQLDALIRSLLLVVEARSVSVCFLSLSLFLCFVLFFLFFPPPPFFPYLFSLAGCEGIPSATCIFRCFLVVWQPERTSRHRYIVTSPDHAYFANFTSPRPRLLCMPRCLSTSWIRKGMIS